MMGEKSDSFPDGTTPVLTETPFALIVSTGFEQTVNFYW